MTIRSGCTSVPSPFIIAILFLAAMLFATWSCSRQTEEPAPSPEGKVEARTKLIIALLPERNVFEQKKKYLPLQEYLSDNLGISVYFKLLDNYEQIFTELIDGQIDGGFWGSMNGTIAQIRGGVEMLARPVWQDKSSTYWGYIFTVKGTGITTDPYTWRGKSMAFVNKATTAGFLYPVSVMRQHGITEDPGAFFSRAIFSGSHDAAILAVFQNEVDMGACKNTIFQEYVTRHPEVREKIVILSESPHVPSNGLGVRPSLPEKMKRNLESTLVSMDESPAGREALSKFGALEFIKTSFEDYQAVITMSEQAGIDLSQWPFSDERGARPYR